LESPKSPLQGRRETGEADRNKAGILDYNTK
jgi:hypothetical protein